MGDVPGNDENEENDDEGFGMYIHESIYACRPTLQNGSRAGLGKNQATTLRTSTSWQQQGASRDLQLVETKPILRGEPPKSDEPLHSWEEKKLVVTVANMK